MMVPTGPVRGVTQTGVPRSAGVARGAAAALIGFAAMLAQAPAQNMMEHLDFSSPEMTEAEFTRGEVSAMLSAAGGQPADFTGKRLNGLDLSGLDFTGAILRSARLNKTDLSGAKMQKAVLDQAWMVEARLAGADLRQASIFQAQLIRAVLDAADLSGARAPANFTKASLKGAKFTDADLSADMRNQSMGLIGGVLRSTNLEGADFSRANLARADLEFATLKGADLTGANLTGAKLGGADLTSAKIGNADFSGADLDSTKLIGLSGAENANLGKAKNLSKAIRR